ncbi:MAG: PIG-L family deacetylase [Legionella sp.]|nr:PIG-L family deacetylase [Legionella sp.]
MVHEPYRILLLEPIQSVATDIISWLQERAQIVHIRNPHEAMEKAALSHWDVVITDINAPDINDLDITAIVKRANPDTSLLIVTEHKKVDFIISAMQNHADGLLFKPLEAKEFVNKVFKLAEDSREKRAKGRKVVLAIGAHPDDVEFGCGGALAKHRADGDSLNILTLSKGEIGGDSRTRALESERAAKMLAATLFLGDFVDTEITHTSQTIQYIEKIVQEIHPTHIYTHSFHDNHQDHRNAYHASITACRQAPNVYCYLSPSSTVDFKPNVFINIDGFIEIKLLVLEAFSSQSTTRPYLEADMIRATARYWGRFSNYHLVEPMEVIKGHS